MKIAYLTSLYPAQSHTFIHREVDAMRAEGLDIVTFSVRRAVAADILGEASAQEAARTRWLVPPNPLALLTSLAWGFFTRPRRMASVLWEAEFGGRMGVRTRALWLAYFGEAVLLAHWLVRDKVDHLHCHFGNSGSNTAYLASRLAGVPLSITFHGIDLDEPRRHRHAVKLAHARFTVCISKFGKSRLMFATPPKDWHKIRVVRCGITPPDSFTPPTFTENRLVCVARLSVEKGHLILLDSLKEIREQGVPFQCTLVGGGPMREELETRVRALGLQDVVTFTGPLAPPQVAEEFKKADSVVLASFGEGIPVVLMEAFSHGRPVIATYVGGIPELVQNGKNGYLVPPGSAPELTGAITRLLADPEAAREMGRKGRETIVSRYREDTGAARLAKLFRGEPLE